MKKDFMAELENQFNIYDIANKEELLKKYGKRYDFGLESGLSDEKIEEMLGDPRDIVKQYLEKKEDSTTSLGRGRISIQTLSDDIEFRYSEDDEIHLEFENVELDNYDIVKEKEYVKVSIKKKKFFSLNRRKPGVIYVEIPKNHCFEAIHCSTTSGDIEIPSIEVEEFKMNMISGDCHFQSIHAKRLTIIIVSGDVNGETAQAEDIRFDTVSGDIEIDFLVGNTAKMDTVSGDIQIEKAKVDAVSSTSVSGDVLLNGENSGTNVKRFIKGMFRK